MELRAIVTRLWGAAVAWTWAYNALRLAAGVLLLPLLLRLLPTPDLGMHFVFQSVAALAIMLDFGLGDSAFRAMCVALAGGTELQPLGLAPPPGRSAAPNHTLLWRIILSLRSLYRRVALASLILLGAVGTFAVAPRFADTSAPSVTWLAWALTLMAVAWELLAGWWGVVLVAQNQVVQAARLNVAAYSIKLLGAAALLLGGAGLLSLPLAGLVSSLVQRHLLRRACLRLLPTPGADARADVRWLLSRLWPTSWRQGLVGAGTHGGNVLVAFLCMTLFGLEASARYGLSIQLMVLMQGIASAWTQVKWPLLMQQRAAGNIAAMRVVFRSRLWLQLLSFVVMACVAVPLAMPVVKLISASKEILPAGWLALLALNAMLEMHLSAWGTLISTENRVPLLGAMLLTRAAGLALAAVLVHVTALGLHSFVLAPLVVGAAFNYWYWPGAGARTLGTGLVRFMVHPAA